MQKLNKLIEEAEALRQTHQRAGRQIEAAAAAIRLRALLDAKEAISTLED